MKQPDIVEWLRKEAELVALDRLAEAADEIEALRELVQIWRDRYVAERQDHEATMKAWDAERSGL